MTLLIIEDDDAIRKEIKTFFKADFDIAEAASIKEALPYLDSDIVLLDLNLGRESSLPLIPKIKSACIVISVQDDEQTIVRALEEGACDYVTKPFSLNVLKARIHAILRRNNSQDIYLNIKNGEPIILIDKKEIILTKKEYQIMSLFLNNSSTVLTRSLILEHIWDKDEAFVEDNTLTVTMSRLKNKIGSSKIETVRGIGYRWKG
ncbi:response regulator transcription factor [Treponema sp. OMZ 787]|uniref:response regulator transcription factor n=1 Tax=Treponema sp. OMZ 787 TaxID=2563669 RepID=UPI0020A4A596|nr:response regulator transcription factor [Treponema sp. OMZ 787]UTC61577.1 response regulator transcription factor [Treponema sp. OMZ 787]